MDSRKEIRVGDVYKLSKKYADRYCDGEKCVIRIIAGPITYWGEYGYYEYKFLVGTDPLSPSVFHSESIFGEALEELNKIEKALYE